MEPGVWAWSAGVRGGAFVGEFVMGGVKYNELTLLDRFGVVAVTLVGVSMMILAQSACTI